MYVDASVKGNPGPSGLGIILLKQDLYEQISLPGVLISNHEAEFLALQTGLSIAIEKNLNSEIIYIYTDSKIVSQTIDQNHATSPSFTPYLNKINQLLEEFPLAIIQWIPERKNKGADNLARQGLQKYINEAK